MYKPTENDIAWAKSVVNVIRQGGILAMPHTGLIYRLDHDLKTLTLINTQQLLEFEAFEVHMRTIATFKKIGYEVKEVES